MRGPKTPWVAAVLALVLGGPGCFYLGWRRGAMATLAWLFACYLNFLEIWAPPILEPEAFAILVMHASLAWMAYRSCERSNAEAARAAGIAIPGTAQAGGVTRTAGRMPPTGWKHAAWAFGKPVLQVAGIIGLILAWVFIELSLADWHYWRIERAVRSGMTIEEVLHTVQESGFVMGCPQLLADEQRHSVFVTGPRDRTYFHYDSATDQHERFSEDQAAAMFRQNMIPGREYSMGFSSTWRYGEHLWMTVILNPQGRVKEVQLSHTWD